tara:strand:- start:1241 stop:1732 length:492 start_codon:yes stop_codon:yes gene_type:complete
MSRSNSSAIRRRTGEPEPIISTQTTPSPSSPRAVAEKRILSTQEVILALNSRISILEESASNNTQNNNNNDFVNNEQLNNIINDLNNKFNTLADEMDEIKNIVIKLQSFTMDVNKMLIEERIQMLSSVGDNNNLKITEELVKIDHDSIQNSQNNSGNNSDQEN